MQVDFSSLRKWETFGAGESAIDLLLEPLGGVDLCRVSEMLGAGNQSGAIQLCLDKMPKAWNQVTDKKGKPIPFTRQHLELVLGLNKHALQAFSAYVAALVTVPAEPSANPPQPPADSPTSSPASPPPPE